MKMAAITTIILLVFATSLTAAPSASSIRTHPTDIDSLKSLKSALGGSTPIPGSCLASWNFSFDPCASASSDRFTCGLRCDTLLSSFARVTHLALDPAGYSGFLSSASLNLPFLQTLSLSDNFLFGPLPASISNLTRLQKLVLSRNSFSGELPDSISALTHLEELCLDNNRFQGRIFNNLMIRKLQRLKRLELQGNLFSGHLPPAALASLPDLYFLDASDNELVGKISPGTLPKSLVELSLRNNSFDSYVPGTFSEVANLQVLDLSHNSLSGSVSRVFFAHQSLQQLSLSHNNLSSIETPSSFNQSSLVSVDMSHNRLQGPLPEFMAWLPALSSLSLEQNRLSGVIPSEYAKRAAAGAGGRTTPFGRLLLGGNYLFGLIPGPLTRLKPGRVNVSLVDNCLYVCPDSFFFCQGATQKSMVDCNRFRDLLMPVPVLCVGPMHVGCF